ncbi:MAG: tetratricopeptide repeat protein [bacterium]|nr:tetratricopeptide repeat protein [bacterium]
MADKAKLFKIAQKHLSKGNLDKAIKTFQQLAEVDPNDQRLILRLAEILARAGRKKEAVENYEKVAAGYIKQDFPPKAIAVYRTILRLDPELFSAYEKLAELYKSQGLEAEALAIFENLFKVYERKNDEDKQIDVLKLMADMDPENLGFQVRLGETLARKGRKKEAAEALAKAAATLSRRGFHDRASQLFEKITALNPDNTAVRRELCAHYLESGKYNEARTEIEAILAIEPDDPRMVLLLGRILFQLGKSGEGEEKISESIKLFLKAGELESVMREFLFVAQSHFNNGEDYEAEAFYRQILSNVPGEVRAIKGLVSVAEKRKDRVGQIDNLLLLGRTMQQAGDREGVIDSFRRVNELDPLNEEAKAYLAGAGPVEPPVVQFEEQSIGLEGEIQDADLDEIEEVELFDAEDMDLEDISEDVLEEDIDEEIQLIDDEEPDRIVLDADEPQVDFGAKEVEEGFIPEIVLEDYKDDFEVDIGDFETVMEVSEVAGDVAGEEAGGETEPAGFDEVQASESVEQLSDEMSLEELLAEAEVYERYGLKEKVAETLEKARVRAPGDQEVLSRIAAFDSGTKVQGLCPVAGDSAQELPETEDPHHDPFSEELEEADFYHSQGLDDEASKIYKSILERDPQQNRALQALSSIEVKGAPDEPGAAEPVDEGRTTALSVDPGVPVETALESRFNPDTAKDVKSKLIVEDSTPEGMNDFLDIAEELRIEIAEEDAAEARIGPADGPVSFEEIFSQFKEGIKETLGDEEYETHYNLGIAYKDMGLYDDAILEFESGTRDPALAQDSFSLMAMCYVEKRDYESAINAIVQAIDISNGGSKTGLFFQLGEVKEKQNLWSEAIKAYEQVQSDDPAFQGIGEAIERVKASLSRGVIQDEPDDLSDGGMDNMLTDLIREVEEMAKESSGETTDEPGKPKKDRISYL